MNVDQVEQLANEQSEPGGVIQDKKRNYCYGMTNKKWISLKALYFFKNGAMGAVMPFLIAFYRSRGLTSSQIGIIECLVPFIGGISRPLAGSVADRTGRTRTILFLSYIFFTASFFSLVFIRPPPASAIVGDARENLTLTNSNATAYSCLTNNSSPQKVDEFAEIFIPIFLLRIISAIPFAPTLSLTDSLIYDLLGEKENHKYWGAQRIFGTIASSVVGGIIGLAVNWLQEYDVIFVVFAIFNIGAAFITMFWLPKNVQRGRKTTNNNENGAIGYWASMRKIGKNHLFIVACIVANLSGWLVGLLFVVWPQWVLFLGAPKLLLGITAVVGRAVEVPSFFFASSLVKRIGDVGCFLVMFAAYSVRFLIIGFLTPSTVWLVVPLELFNVLTFVLFVTSLTRYGAAISYGKGSSASIQAILQSCYLSVGFGIGNLCSSEIYQMFGGQATFFFHSACSAFCCVIFAILHYAFLRKLALKTDISETPSIPLVKGSNINIEQPSPAPVATKNLTNDNTEKTLIGQN